KVVSQSIAPGTPVPKGSPVDIVLAPPRLLPIDIVPDFHVGLADRTIGTVFDDFVRDSPAVKNVLARNQTAATLSTADRGILETALAAREVPVTSEPGQSIEQAFSTLQAAFTFGG